MAQRAVGHAKIFLLAMLLQACTGMSTPDQMSVYNLANINVQMQNGMLFTGDEPFTGIIYSLQSNKKDTAEIVCFNQGHEHGLWKKFYACGRLSEQRYYNNGKKVGEFKAWWPNGVIKLNYHFKNGEYEGSGKEWSAKGLLMASMHYKNGYEDGHQLQYYDDGKIKANYMIIKGRRYGLLGTKNCVNVTDSLFKK